MRLLTRGGSAVLAATLTLGGVTLLPATGYAATPPDVQDTPISLDHGHIDAFNLVLNDDNSPRMTLKEDVTGSHVLREPESVELVVKEEARTSMPEGYLPGLSGEVYHLPLTQNHKLIWPGWDTQSITSAFPAADTDIVVSDVEGPGRVFLWTQNWMGQPVSLLKGGGYELPASISQPYPAHTHAAWAFTKAGVYTLTVRADVKGSNGHSASTSTHTYTFIVGEQPVQQSVEITGLRHHYHQGTQIVLNADTEPVIEGASYEWSLQRKDQLVPVIVADQTDAEFVIAAEQALDDAKVSVRLLDSEGKELAAAEPVTIDIDDHGAEPLNTLRLSGDKRHYLPGDTAKLTASVDPASVLTRYEWFVQPEGDTEWTAIKGQNGTEFSYELHESVSVQAKLTFDDGTTYVTSQPVLLKLDDRPGEETPETELSIGTDRSADDYWVGQTAKLTAKQSVTTGLDEYAWFVKAPGAAEFSQLEESSGETYSFKPTLENSGTQFKVQLFDEGKVHAESAPVTITVQQREFDGALSIAADKPSYVPGDVAHLVTKLEGETTHDHWHWYVQRPGTDDFTWVDGSREKDLDYPVTAADSGALLLVRLFDDTHAMLAEAKIVLEVENGDEQPVKTELTIDGLEEHYEVGDVAQLTATQNPTTAEDHYHGFIKRAGDDDFSMISGALSATLEYTVAEGDNGAQIITRLYSQDHAVLAESAPASIKVDSRQGREPAGETPSGKLPGVDGESPGGVISGSGGPTGQLPGTGSEKPTLMIGAAALLILLGLGAMAAVRRPSVD